MAGSMIAFMYMTQVMALWNAHSNILVVSDSNWKGYLAKYATKADPRGKLTIDEAAARQLGLAEYSQEQVHPFFSSVDRLPGH
jgi:hypothetical protein